jgi:hypothetical protein
MKWLGVAASVVAVALALCGVMVSPASAAPCKSPCLPTILLSSEATWPAELTGPADQPNNEIKFELQNREGAFFPGKGLSLLFSFTNLKDIADGTYLERLLDVEEPVERTKCTGSGDRTGEVLLSMNLLLLVYDTMTPLGIAALLLVNEFELVCEGWGPIKVRGSMLVLLEPLNERLEKETIIMHGTLHCASGAEGVPMESKYWNEKAELTLIPTLLANFGAGFEKVCQEIVPPITLLPSEEVELMG